VGAEGPGTELVFVVAVISSSNGITTNGMRYFILLVSVIVFLFFLGIVLYCEGYPTHCMPYYL
jgi:hypothetical protein